jgi:hypothetical protein
MEAPLRRRSTLENGITAVLLVGITPPLPIEAFCAHLHLNVPSDEPRAGQSATERQIPDCALSAVAGMVPAGTG